LVGDGVSGAAIKVSGLGKRYRIGTARKRHDRLSEVIVKPLMAPVRYLTGKGEKRASPSAIWALRDVSFDVGKGEVLGIIGRNGSGKSTLLKILARITEPTEGQAEIRGRTGALLEVGTGFHGDLTGRENVYLNGAILGMKRREIDRKFDEIVAFSEVEQFLDTQVKHYSSGMQVRLAFAVAAHLDPEVLFLDEVLAVGDHAFRQKCYARIREVYTSGRTVLLVSHDMDSVKQLCTQAMWLEKGRIQALGKPSEVVAEYLPQGEPSK
jgi:lipopolysaccharide transport system ATP-binding protein